MESVEIPLKLSIASQASAIESLLQEIDHKGTRYILIADT